MFILDSLYLTMNNEFVNISKSDKIIVELVFTGQSNKKLLLEKTLVSADHKPSSGDLVTYKGSFFKVVDSKEKRNDDTSLVVKCFVKLADIE